MFNIRGLERNVESNVSFIPRLRASLRLNRALTNIALKRVEVAMNKTERDVSFKPNRSIKIARSALS